MISNWPSVDELNVKLQQYGANAVYTGLTPESAGKFTSDFIAAATADFRCPKAMVEVTWGAGNVDENVVITSNDINRIDRTGQVRNGVNVSGQKWAYIHSGLIADGSFYAMPELDTESQMGWYGTLYQSDGSGNFATAPWLQVSHDARGYTAITVAGDSGHNEYPVDFSLTFTHAGGPTVVNVIGNTDLIYTSTFTAIKDVTAVRLTVTKWSAANTIVKIAQLSGTLIELYKASDIIELSVLEETNSDTGVVPIGNVSANELDLSLMNTERRFSYGNTDSIYNSSLKSGRKIRLWLGFILPAGSADATGDVPGYIVETVSGEKHGYMPYGIYWSKDWISSYESMATTTTAYDVIYRLSQKEFTRSINYSDTVENIVNEILTAAQEEISELSWAVSPDTSGLVWNNVAFEPKNYLEILKDIAEASQSFTFADRDGKIQVGSFLEAATPLESWQQVGLSDYFNFRSDPKLDELINRIRVGFTAKYIQTNIFTSDREYEIGSGGSEKINIDWNVEGVDTSTVVITLIPVVGTPNIGSSEIFATGADVVVTGSPSDKFRLAATGTPLPVIYADEDALTVPAAGTITIDLVWKEAPVYIPSVVLSLAPVSGLSAISSSSIYAYGASVTVLGTAGATFKLTTTGTPYTQEENTETVRQNDASIKLYGVREFSLTGNALVNSQAQAEEIAAQMLSFYGSLRQDGAMTWPANTLLAVGDTLEVVEFKSDTVETKSYFIIKRQTTTYDGSLMGSTELRRG